MLRTCIWVLSCIVSITALQAKETPKPLLFTADHWAPFVIENGNGHTTGLDVAIIAELAKRVGTTVHTSVAPWKRCLFHIQEGQADIISHLSYRKSRESFVYYLKPAYFEKDYKVLFVHAGSRKTIRTLKDLKGMQIGVIRGAVYGEAFDKAMKDGVFEAFKANTLETMIKMVEAKRIDGFINTLAPAKYAIAKLGAQQAVKETDYQIITDKHLYLGLSLKSSWFAQRKVLEKALAEMVADGTLKTIQSRYLD